MRSNSISIPARKKRDLGDDDGDAHAPREVDEDRGQRRDGRDDEDVDVGDLHRAASLMAIPVPTIADVLKGSEMEVRS